MFNFKGLSHRNCPCILVNADQCAQIEYLTVVTAVTVVTVVSEWLSWPELAAFVSFENGTLASCVADCCGIKLATP